MSIRFAAAGTGESASVARVLSRRAALSPSMPANDVDGGLAQDLLLRSALRHFARHGLGAAQEARNIALRAKAQGDNDQYRQWLGICRKLDRQIATRMIASHGTGEF
jgi:hypothetical protein